MSSDSSYNKLFNSVKKKIKYRELQKKIDCLDDEIDISTITICSKFDDTLIDSDKIYKYLPLGDKFVVNVGDRSLKTQKKSKGKKPKHRKKKKHKGKGKDKGKKISTDITDILEFSPDEEINNEVEKKNKDKEKNKEKDKKTKSKLKSKTSGKKKKKKYKKFKNQINIKILVPDKNIDKPVDVKIFDNGSIQMTGCVTLKDAVDAICRTIIALNATIEVDKAKIKFSEEKLLSKNLISFSLKMINSKFSVGFWIDRSKLLKILTEEKMNVNYDNNKHASVIIKHIIDDIGITLLVFEKGSVLMSVRNIEQISEAYNFINKKLLENYEKISKTDIETVRSIIKNYVCSFD